MSVSKSESILHEWRHTVLAVIAITVSWMMKKVYIRVFNMWQYAQNLNTANFLYNLICWGQKRYWDVRYLALVAEFEFLNSSLTAFPYTAYGLVSAVC